MRDKTCIIIGAGNVYTAPAVSQGDIVIAADGGYKSAVAFGIAPDIVLGDFDSLGYVPDAPRVIRHPVKKDDTDTSLAVKTGFSEGFRRFEIYGGTGGRVDHTIANIQLLAYISLHDGRGYLIADNWTATAVTDGSIHFRKIASGTVSVFAACGSASGVYLKGLLYPLTNAVLTPSFPLGVSNSFTGVPAEVSVGDGSLLTIWYGGTDWVKE